MRTFVQSQVLSRKIRIAVNNTSHIVRSKEEKEDANWKQEPLPVLTRAGPTGHPPSGHGDAPPAVPALRPQRARHGAAPRPGDEAPGAHLPYTPGHRVQCLTASLVWKGVSAHKPESSLQSVTSTGTPQGQRLHIYENLLQVKSPSSVLSYPAAPSSCENNHGDFLRQVLWHHEVTTLKLQCTHLERGHGVSDSKCIH